MSRRVLLALGVLLAGGALAFVLPPTRAALKGLYLRLGDAWVELPEPQLDARGLVLVDGSDPGDRDALAPRSDEVQIGAGEGGGTRLHGAATPAEVCTRRIVRDWSRFRVLRVEYRSPSGGRCRGQDLPLLFTLRLRGRPGWRETRWFLARQYLSRARRELELGLDPVSRLVDLSDVRELCLALGEAAGPHASPRRVSSSITIERVLLLKDWSPEGRGASPAEPWSVSVIGESTKLRRFDPLPEAPHLFEDGVLTLHAARNETVALQVVVRGWPRPGTKHTARVAVGPLIGEAASARIAPLLFEERTLEVREPSSAMYGWGSPGPGEYPDPLVPLEGPMALGSGNHLVWVDVPVPEEAAPGEYRGRVQVTIEPGARSADLPLRVRVRPLVLPHAGRNLVMVGYSPHLLRAVLGLEGEPFFALEREYHRLVHGHGAYLVTDPSLESMERFAPMLDGSLYTEDPGKGEGARYWPVDLMASEREGVQRAARAAVEWFRRRAPRTRPFAYVSDEPGTAEEHERIRRVAEWIHSAPPPGNELPVMVTAPIVPVNPAWPSLEGAVDYWVSPENFPEPATSRQGRVHAGTRGASARSQARPSERFFTYNGAEPLAGSHLLDADGVSLRTWGWIAYLMGIDMWFLWDGAYYRDVNNAKGADLGRQGGPHLDPLTFDQRRTGKDADFGNGDGVLVYPPLVKGGAPIASVRLKQVRRGVQDRLYLLLLEACGAGERAKRIARRLFPRVFGEAKGCLTSWPKSEEPFERARHELIGLLESCARSEQGRGQ